MSTETNINELLSQYLLGSLTEEENRQIEERYFADDELFDRLRLTESELIEKYIQDELGSEERGQFESYFLQSRERGERVEFARALMGCVSKHMLAAQPYASVKEIQASRWESIVNSFHIRERRFAFSMALATLLILIGGVFLINQINRLQNRSQQGNTGEPAPQQTARESPGGGGNNRAQDQPTKQGQDAGTQRKDDKRPVGPPLPKQERPSPAIVSFVLSGNLLRGGGETQRLSIPPDARTVQLQIPVEETNYKKYQINLKLEKGESWNAFVSSNKATNSHKTILVNIPAKFFVSGDYRLALSGFSGGGKAEEIGKYYFRIINR
jgi:hypothetical protein